MFAVKIPFPPGSWIIQIHFSLSYFMSKRNISLISSTFASFGPSFPVDEIRNYGYDFHANSVAEVDGGSSCHVDQARGGHGLASSIRHAPRPFVFASL